jgi:hypothetical protein
MARCNKGIKGSLRVKFKKEYLNNIQMNKDIFADIIERNFCFTEYDIYIAEFGDEKEEYIVIDFNMLSDTFSEVKKYLNKFKQEIKNHFGFKPDNYFSAQYEKVI